MSMEWEAYWQLRISWAYFEFTVLNFENHGAAWFAILSRGEFEDTGLSNERFLVKKPLLLLIGSKIFVETSQVCAKFIVSPSGKKFMLWWRHRWRQYFSEFRADQTIGIFSDLNFYKLNGVKILIRATSWKNMKPS